ncbi:hypothetical protein MATL_G00080980 [Megalops atlanticus]|uniref:Ubiquitin thioesterase OTU n=1 Tax=Megalops atlanticus TaxID=7932 RepID=A0A9D3Q600_MEGAT|nr:hypothetical protein MATL_G00080980 [Megalops atlanticus]
MLRLRCKAKNGTHLLQGLTQQSCVQELKDRIEQLTGIPCQLQKIMVGFPPSSLDLRDSAALLRDCPVKSGDTLIVEEENTLMPQGRVETTGPRPGPRPGPLPVLVRRTVPADNSCLFTSVSYAVECGVYDPSRAPELRELVAQAVASDPATFSEAVLGRPNAEYCAWIRRADAWGGAIELSILCRLFRRVLLIYDGVHYEPLQREAPGSAAPPQTVFPAADAAVLAQALQLADEARRGRSFTDLQRLTLRCTVCRAGLAGQQQARQHAKDTGHTSFREA